MKPTIYESVLLKKVEELKHKIDGFYFIQRFENGSAWGVIIKGEIGDDKVKREFLNIREELSDINYDVVFRFIHKRFKESIQEKFIF